MLLSQIEPDTRAVADALSPFHEAFALAGSAFLLEIFPWVTAAAQKGTTPVRRELIPKTHSKKVRRVLLIARECPGTTLDGGAGNSVNKMADVRGLDRDVYLLQNFLPRCLMSCPNEVFKGQKLSVGASC